MKQILIPALLAVNFALPVMGQELAPTPGGPEDESGSGWTFMLGAMGTNRPSYLGSNERSTDPEPFVMFDYRGRVGLTESQTMNGAVGLYARPLKTESWSLGLLAMTEIGGRKEKAAKALKGMGDRDTYSFVGLDLTYQIEEYKAGLEVLKGTKQQSGMVAGLSFGRSMQLSEDIGMEMGVTGVWGNKDYQAWEFGITPVQAARRQALIQAGNRELKAADGRPFTPKAGMREIKATTMVRWAFRPRWMTFGTLQYGRLLGDAAKSPLTRSRNQASVGIGCAYRFGGGSEGGPDLD